MAFAHKHLLGIEPLSREDILAIVSQARTFKEILRRPIKKVPALRGKTVVNLFFESSTRTRSSFEIAAKILSADAVNWTASGSSVSKGETLVDTARNLEAMRPDVLVIRHSASGAPHLVASHVRCAVINAGDGAHEHPSQALLDALTLTEKLGDLAGRTVAIVGDITHSRVARSNLRCLTKLGAKVRVCGPPTMIPLGIEQYGCTVHYTLAEALQGADAVMMLRIQTERMQEPLFPSGREYARLYGLGLKNVELLKPDAVILHPGPVNRGVELAPEVADGPRSVILDQVENGVAVRMALIYLMCGGEAASA
ncbi:MAG: aspartate carbamoyltransferase catalytic subunit [Myxococcales bacterium]